MKMPKDFLLLFRTLEGGGFNITNLAEGTIPRIDTPPPRYEYPSNRDPGPQHCSLAVVYLSRTIHNNYSGSRDVAQ